MGSRLNYIEPNTLSSGSNKIFKQGKIVFASIGEKTGNISVLGPSDILDKIGKEVLSMVNGKAWFKIKFLAGLGLRL